MAPTQAIYAIHSTELASSLVPAQDNAQDTAAQPLSWPSRRVPRSTGLYGASDPYFLDGARKKYATDRNILRRSAVSLRASWTPDGTGTLGAQLSRRATLKPNSTQRVTLGVIGAYIAVIAIVWHIPYVKYVLYPFKMLTIAFHEFSHAATGCCTGARIKSITLDPREGGCTMMSGGVSWITLPAGYLGSSLIGAAMIVCGFDIVASKACSFVLAAGFLITLWWSRRDWLTIVTILLAVAGIVACWFIAHGAALRFYVLFLGVMNCLYSIWDIADDLIFRKVNESDASVFAKRYGGAAQCWGVLWAIVSLASLIGGILVGLLVFKDSFSEQTASSSDFLPTRRWI